MRLEQLRRIFKDRAHLEALKMWSEDAMNYCKKEGDFWEWGNFL